VKQAVARNETTGAIIAPRTDIADGIWTRFRGLMLRGPLAEDEAMLIKPSSSVHMFFMRYPLDIVFIAKDSTVVKVVPHLKQWRLALGGKGAHSALELPAGKAAGISVGHRLAFDSTPA